MRGMEHKYAIVALLLGALAVGLLFVANVMMPSTSAENPQSGRVMSIESYVSTHIADLSPEKAVLGGTFYVTSIKADSGSGVVSYEDGHVAYTADFTYTTDVDRGIT